MRSALSVIASLSTCIGSMCAAGCTTADDVVIDVGPTGPAKISFVDPAANAACRAIGNDATARVPLLLDVVNVILRPPGACGSYQQCGHVRLLADGIVNNEGVAEAIDLLAAKLANPYRTLKLRAELIDDNDKPMVASSPLAAEIEVRVAQSCQ